MAALIVGCIGLLSCKLSKKSRDRREREEEYNSQFEVLKEENAKRVRQLSKSSHHENAAAAPGDNVMDGPTTTTTTMAIPASAPPSYDDVAGHAR